MLVHGLICAAALLGAGFTPVDIEIPLIGAGDLDDLPLLKGGIKRISSQDRNSGGDRDYFQVAPGDTLTLAEIKEPGIIKRIFIKVDSDDPYHLRDMVLRFYWDGAKKPAVESPLGDFFGLGHARYANIVSEPIVTGNKRGLTCFFPMPFRKRALLILANEGRGKANKVAYQIDYESGMPPGGTIKFDPGDIDIDDVEDFKFVQPRGGAGYFHAQYAQGIMRRSSADYIILHVKGRGKYVGTVLSIVLGEDGWFWKGDEKFFIDGEDVPSVAGTGMDDYFGSAWGFEHGFTAPYFGTPVAGGTSAGSEFTGYRFHIKDPIVFEKELLVTMEHRGQSFVGGVKYDEAVRQDEFYSVAFWYQDGPEHGYAPIPYAAERVSGDRRFTVEAEQMEIAESSEDAVTYEVAGGESILVFNADEEGDQITLRASVPVAGEYEIAGVILRSRDSGVYRLKVNGISVGGLIDFYNDRGGQGRECRLLDDKVVFGRITLAAGTVLLRFDAEGANEKTEGVILGIDALILRPVQ